MRGDVDVAGLDRRISGLDKRQFVLQSAHLPAPVQLTSRWAMSYLAGPLTGEQLRTLTADDPTRLATAASATPAPATGIGASRGQPTAVTTATPAMPGATVPSDATVVMPPVADGTPVRWLDPAAPWGDQVGVAPDGPVCEAAVVARVALRYDDRTSGVDHRQEWEAVWFPLAGDPDPADAVTVEYDDRDLRDTAPEGVAYRIPDARIDRKAWFARIGTALRDHLRREEQITVLRNPALQLWSRVDETRDDFLARCDATAQHRADAEAAELTEQLRRTELQLDDTLVRAQQRVAQLEVDEDSRRRSEVLTGRAAAVGPVRRPTLHPFGRHRPRRAVGGLTSRRGTTSRTAQRRDTAERQVERATDELAELEGRLADELAAIDARWRLVAGQVEEATVGLERDDIDVTDVTLVWVRRDA